MTREVQRSVKYWFGETLHQGDFRISKHWGQVYSKIGREHWRDFSVRIPWCTIRGSGDSLVAPAVLDRDTVQG